MIDFGVGRRDWIGGEATEFGLSVRKPLSSRLFGYVDTNYSTHGSWLALVGLEFRFGGVQPAAASPKGVVVPRRTAWDDPTIATLFNSGEAKTFYGVTPNGFSTPAPPTPAAPPAPPSPEPEPDPEPEPQ